MKEAQQMATAVLEGQSPREFLKALHRPIGQQLQRLGFRPYPHRNDLWGHKFARPASMPTNYAYGDMVLMVQKNQSGDTYEIGLCTMGQYGADYPDIWLGRFPKHALVNAVQAAMRLLWNLDQFQPTYDALDRLLRSQTAHLREGT